MIYFKKFNLKIYLVLLSCLITLNVLFNSTEKYTANYEGDRIINASEMQYQICLSSLSFYKQTEFISNTEIKYFNNLSEESILYIYLGYLGIAIGFILSAKFSLKDPTNEDR